MFNLRDFSRLTFVVVVFAVLGCAFTVRALTVSTPTRKVADQPLFIPEAQVDSETYDLLVQNTNVKVGDTFTVTIVAENVKDMYGWQVFLGFDGSSLECLGASLPTNNVFSDSVTVAGALMKCDPTEFPQSQSPIMKIRNDEGWILAGDCLLGRGQPTFYGSGTLCQVNFKAISPGSKTLILLQDATGMFQTFSISSNLSAKTSQSSCYLTVNVSSN